MKLFAQPFLQPEHWPGTQASQPEAPSFLGFNEVPVILSHTSAMNFRQGTNHPGGQDISADISDDPDSRQQIQPCCLKAIASYSSASAPKRCLSKGGAEQIRTTAVQLRGTAFD